MKPIIFLFCIASLLAKGFAENEEELKIFKDCLDENGIKEDVDKIKDKGNPKLRCIVACMLEKEGLMKDDEFDIVTMKKDVLSEAEKLDEKEVEKIVDNCVNVAKDLTDKCDKANVVTLCIKDELEKHGIKLE